MSVENCCNLRCVVYIRTDRVVLACELGILNHTVTHTELEKFSCDVLVLFLPLPAQYRQLSGQVHFSEMPGQIQAGKSLRSKI